MKLFILILLIIILPGLTLLSLKKVTGLKQTNEGKVLFFYGDKNYSYTFISPEDNLNSVVLKLKNILIKNSEVVKFSLLDKRMQPIRNIDINGSNIPDGDLVRFAFEPISNSKGKEYTIFLSSPKSTEEKSIGIHTDPENNPVLITYHQTTSKISLISKIYQDFILRVFADKIFISIWFLLLTLSIYITNKYLGK